ncbi:hypothetical protein GQ53DRAFT_725719 [Thozetella sp. PMI_491]|nr:hypothetical protein GQ53DRAFT_725719 [Thozetella sp. PMI_491]
MKSQSTPASRRRDKPILSCTFCRGRKLRCDRQSPCGACTRRGQPGECVYTCSEQDRKDAIDYRPHVRNQQARQRIARLEHLVTEMRDMVENSRQPPQESAASSETPVETGASHASAEARITDDMGNLSITDDHAVYTGSSHWVTILEDIHRLKDELSSTPSGSTRSQEQTIGDPDLIHNSPVTRISLLNSAPSIPRDQLLAMVPPRRVVDRHVSQFFNTFDMAPFVLHRGKFLAEYTNFWDNQSAVPIMWVGLLFSVMTMSAFLQQQDAEARGLPTSEPKEMLTTYRDLTIHCLVSGNYLRSSRYTLETLILHFAVDQNVNLDASISNWILIGVIVRVALRMGLHRDPSHWSDIRPLQAEIRRRLWISLYQMDFFTSIQVGLPRIIKDSQCDTRPPAHLLDQDIGLEHDEMPPERPLTEPTPFLYIIQRHAIIKVLAEIYDATDADPPSPATIAALADKLKRAVEGIPVWLKYKSLETSIADNPVTILHQITLDVLIQKATYLLHRQTFMKGSAGKESTKSTEICVDAALAILQHQRRMSEETLPGGLMFNLRWKVASSLNHEYLQATMILCLALSTSKERPAGTPNPSGLYRRDEIFEALNLVKRLWEKNANQSNEAQVASNAIATVLEQDSEKPSGHAMEALDRFFDQMPGLATQNYFGEFDYEQNLILDPSLLAVDGDVTTFGSMLDDFMPS